MYKYASSIFWLTLIFYLVTLFTVSYVGVYLTYIVLPILLVSFPIMLFLKPKKTRRITEEHEESFFEELNDAACDLVEGTNDFLDEVNVSFEKYNKTNKLVSERSKLFREKIKICEVSLKRLKLELENAEKSDDKSNLQASIRKSELEIEVYEKAIEQIRYACELEVNARYS